MSCDALSTASASRQCPTTSPFGRRPALPHRCARRALLRAEGRKDTPGYMKEDSAGQENIFAVESKSFVAGSSKDTGTNTVANAAIAGVAIAVGALAIGAGVFLTKDKAAVSPAKLVEEAPKESLSSISRRIGPIVKKPMEEASSVAPALSN